MARLPVIGGDTNSWGEVLNEYLQVAHATDGTIKTDTIGGNLDAVARVAIAKNASTAGARRTVNLIPGTNVDIQTADNAGNERVDVTIGLTGSVALANGGTGGTTAATARTNLAVPQAAGFAKITVGTVAPSSPAVGDIWIDTN